jgi:hypothetical protein
MALHLIKLCVGVDTVEELERWVASRKRHAHLTRQTPKRAEEVLDGGSLYWVIKGVVQCRQAVLGLQPAHKEGVPACRIVLSPQIVRTAPALRRPFQGWRYLNAADAPSDIGLGNLDNLPPELRKQLIEIGAW